MYRYLNSHFNNEHILHIAIKIHLYSYGIYMYYRKSRICLVAFMGASENSLMQISWEKEMDPDILSR